MIGKTAIADTVTANNFIRAIRVTDNMVKAWE
jgi:hypothetical protein